MKLSTKLILISLAGFVVIFILSLTGTMIYYNDVREEQISKTVAQAEHNFQVAMEAKENVWVTNALQVANNSEVKDAVKTKDRKKVDEILNRLGLVFKENTGFKNVEVHLIDKDLRSFYKSWDFSSYGERLSHSDGYRKVKSTVKPSVAMEVSSKGLRLKGLFPIVDNGEFLGIANFEGGLNSLKRSLKPYGIDFIYFMDSDDLDIAKSMGGKPKIGKYVLSQKDVDNEFYTYLKKDGVFDKILENTHVVDGDYLTVSGKFKTFSEKKKGLYLLGIKTANAMENVRAEKKLIFTLFGFLFAVFFVLVLFIIAFIKFNAVNPINRVVESLEEIANGDGDLTKRIKVKSRDEIGDLAKWFNAFIERINNIIVEIGENAETVTAASGELKEVSEQMKEDLSDLSGRANTVAAASEEMSSNMNSVAAASNQAASNISSISESASQMEITLNEINTTCERAKRITDNASGQIKTATDRVEHLGNSAQQVSQVIQVINDIAEQTNLLALNATIEAARAGEAGKGFAVVASEIKSLARQTAEGTEQIKQHITGIQTSTVDTVEDVNGITKVITDFNDIVSTIVAAIEEQVISAKNVAQNIGQASDGLSEVNKNVSQSSFVSNEISKDISGVDALAGDMSNRSSRMSRSAKDLADLSLNLRDMISVFKVSKENLRRKGNSIIKDSDVQDLMPWGPKLKLDIEDIDSQHKKLVFLVNKLHKAMKLGKGGVETTEILKELTDYTVYHFGFEEKLFDKYGFNEKESHKKEHQKLVEKVLHFSKELKSGKASLTMDLMEFLKEWLKSHIMVTDRKYRDLFREKHK